MNFKEWLSVDESLINLGQKREPKVSGFCLHNPQINQFAKENSKSLNVS